MPSLICGNFWLNRAYALKSQLNIGAGRRRSSSGGSARRKSRGLERRSIRVKSSLVLVVSFSCCCLKKGPCIACWQWNCVCVDGALMGNGGPPVLCLCARRPTRRPRRRAAWAALAACVGDWHALDEVQSGYDMCDGAVALGTVSVLVILPSDGRRGGWRRDPLERRGRVPRVAA